MTVQEALQFLETHEVETRLANTPPDHKMFMWAAMMDGADVTRTEREDFDIPVHVKQLSTIRSDNMALLLEAPDLLLVGVVVANLTSIPGTDAQFFQGQYDGEPLPKYMNNRRIENAVRHVTERLADKVRSQRKRA